MTKKTTVANELLKEMASKKGAISNGLWKEIEGYREQIAELERKKAAVMPPFVNEVGNDFSFNLGGHELNCRDLRRFLTEEQIGKLVEESYDKILKVLRRNLDFLEKEYEKI